MKKLKTFLSGMLAMALIVGLTSTVMAAETKKETSAPKPAGQFSQWFPDMGVDPENPEASEAALASMGTVINQTKTVGGETLTLNAAVWNGSSVRLSLTAKSQNFPKGLDENSWLNSDACTARMPEAQWKEYVERKIESESAGENLSKEERDQWFQYLMEQGQGQMELNPNLGIVSREGNTVQFVASILLDPYLEKPELTLHIENVAIRDQGTSGSVLKGPFEFTFALNKVFRPMNYEGNTKVTIGKIPMRITAVNVLSDGVRVSYALDASSSVMAKKLSARVEGVWTKDGKYVNCATSFAVTGVMTTADGRPISGHLNRNYPYALDPATVTAVKISGVRVELSGLKLQTK